MAKGELTPMSHTQISPKQSLNSWCALGLIIGLEQDEVIGEPDELRDAEYAGKR